MSVTCQSKDRSMIASIYGDIDHHSAKATIVELERQISYCLPQTLVLDCSGISFMDSSGIAILLRLRKKMDELSGSLAVVGLPPQPAKVLRAAKLDRLITFQ